MLDYTKAVAEKETTATTKGLNLSFYARSYKTALALSNDSNVNHIINQNPLAVTTFCIPLAPCSSLELNGCSCDPGGKLQARNQDGEHQGRDRGDEGFHPK